MQNQITYLIGAGASANALPVVNGIPGRMADVRNLFDGIPFSDKEYFSFDVNHEVSKLRYKNKFLADLDRLMLAVKDHSSADTYAKKLFLQKNDEELDRLKLMLSILFTVIQACPGGFDNRYDAFFASILHQLDKFPSNLRILSWNYDQQFELGYSRFSKRGLDDAYQSLRVQFKHAGKSLHNEYRNDDFSIIKLNGSTGLIGMNRTLRSLYSDYRVNKDQNNGIDPNDGFCYNSNLADFLLGRYSEMLLPYENGSKTNMLPLMSFAWEQERFDENHILTKAVTSCISTEILVIIGYSFPYFNREIDMKLLENMPKLKKIYIQDFTPSDIEDRITTLMSVQNSAKNNSDSQIKFIHIKNLNQFVIPHEL